MAHPYITAPTGGPKITTDFDPSDPSYAALTLSLPDFDEYLEGRLVDESDFATRLSNSLSVVRVKQRRRFSFGYKDLATVTAEALIDILKTRTVRFTPRTLAAGDPSDPSSLAEVVEYTCRVVGEVPFTRHLTTGYRITVNLEELDVREGASVQDDLAPPVVATIGGVVVGGTSPTDTEPTLIGSDPGDPSADCVVHRQGFATFPAYDPSDPSQDPSDPSLLYITIAPSPPFPEELNDADADVELSAWLSGPPYGIESIWVPRTAVQKYHFEVHADQPPATTDATIAWRGTMVRNLPRCRPCWARNRWYSIYPNSEYECAPFPDVMTLVSNASSWSNMTIYNGYIYWWGYRNVTFFFKKWEIPVYDASTGTYTGNGFTDLTSGVPSPSGATAVPAARIGNILYAVSVFSLAAPDLWQFNMDTEVWTDTGINTPFDRSSASGVLGTQAQVDAGTNEIVWVMCSDIWTTKGKKTYTFDGTSFSAGPDFPGVGSYLESFGVCSNLLTGNFYVFGGYDEDDGVPPSAGSVRRAVYYTDGSTWTSATKMLSPLTNPICTYVAGTASGGEIHIVGGSPTNENSTQVFTHNLYDFTGPEAGVPRDLTNAIAAGTGVRSITGSQGISHNGLLYLPLHVEFDTALGAGGGNWGVGEMWVHTPHWQETINPYTGKSTDDI